MPLLRVLKFPANAMLMNEVILALATFDLIPTDSLDEKFFPNLPEENAYTVNFEQCGYESELLVGNLGMAGYVIYINLALAVLVLPAFFFYGRCSRRVTGYFYWNGLIKLFMEMY